MKLSYLDTVRDSWGETMRVKVVLEREGDCGPYIHRVLDAEGLSHRRDGEPEDGFDIRAILAITAPNELARIRSEAYWRWADCYEQEEAFAADIRWSQADEVTHEMCVEMDAVSGAAFHPWRRR